MLIFTPVLLWVASKSLTLFWIFYRFFVSVYQQSTLFADLSTKASFFQWKQFCYIWAIRKIEKVPWSSNYSIQHGYFRWVVYVFMLNFWFVFFLKKKEKRNKYSFRFYKIGTSGQCFSQILPAWHAIEMVETCSFSYAPLKFCTMTPNFDPVFSQYSINCSCSDVGFSKLAPVLYTVGL